jgi:hypothetical protein
LDALPVGEVRGRVRNAIQELIDFELWNRQVAVQEVELKCIAEFADTVKNLPQLPVEPPRPVEKERYGRNYSRQNGGTTVVSAAFHRLTNWPLLKPSNSFSIQSRMRIRSILLI